jgi:hypothetical protein
VNLAVNVTHEAGQSTFGKGYQRVEGMELDVWLAHAKLHQIGPGFADQLGHHPRLDSGDAPTFNPHEIRLGATLTGLAADSRGSVL